MLASHLKCGRNLLIVDESPCRRIVLWATRPDTQRSRGVEPGSTWNRSCWWSGQNYNLPSPDSKSSTQTSQLHCLPKKFKWNLEQWAGHTQTFRQRAFTYHTLDININVCMVKWVCPSYRSYRWHTLSLSPLNHILLPVIVTHQRIHDMNNLRYPQISLTAEKLSCDYAVRYPK